MKKVAAATFLSLMIFATSAQAYYGGVRAYRTMAWDLDWLDHTYPCRVTSSTQKASYCELSNVYGACPTDSNYCPSSWIGDGWCDPGCMREFGHDGGDCSLDGEPDFYCKGVTGSGKESDAEGGERKGNSYYSWDTWFSSSKGWSQTTLHNKFAYVVNESGECEISYGIDGTCHQHANRGLWFSGAMPTVSDFDVQGSGTSEFMYGELGGNWDDWWGSNDCKGDIL